MWQSNNWRKWKVIVKLDPDKIVEDELLKRIVASPRVDAVIVGGTQNITKKNTDDLIRLIKTNGYQGPLVQEISQLEAISLNVDGYLLPIVLNTNDRDWFIGKHLEAVKTFGHFIDWSKILPEAYVICNPQCAAAQLTQALPPSLEDVIAYLTLVEEVFRFPIIYLEYSGLYGSKDWVRMIKERRQRVHIFYGGGIESIMQAEEMQAVADTIVLGNAIYHNAPKFLDFLDSLHVKTT